ncbi:MAG: response regulator [Myxococcota bacterium]
MAKRVLIIDDSEMALRLISEALSSYGIDVIATISPGAFFQRVFSDEKPDLILTDMEMPNISGSDICRQLKNDPRSKEIPLVILSNLPLSQLERTAHVLGADACLCKATFDEAVVANVLLPLLGLK